jgi:myo-inositol-hexaphosphate 3-phosphohydrolase/2',3'-cyclic-nucleotide 2'-phosphodiesterase (5'-nucleotidase family)
LALIQQGKQWSTALFSVLMIMALFLVPVLAATQVAAQEQDDSNFTLQILHSSDNESAFQDPNTLEPKILNYAAIAAGLQALTADEGIASIHLTAGDHTLPGPFYQASAEVESLGARGLADIAIFNAMGLTANGIGNHEFDSGINDFATMLAAADYPFLAVNLDFSQVELAEGTPAIEIGVDGASVEENAGKVARSAYIEVNGERIGLIGRAPADFFNVIADPATTMPGLDFVGGRNAADNQPLVSAVELVLEQVDLLESQGINKIVLLDHAQDFTGDPLSAQRLRGIDVIVAAGSTGFMARPEADGPFNLLRPGNQPQAAYPTLRLDSQGDLVAVVNSDQLFTYVGNLILTFNEDGKIVRVDPRSGPIATTADAMAALSEVTGAEVTAPAAVQEIYDALQATELIQDQFRVIGATTATLNGDRAAVRSQETNLGRLAADSTLWFARQQFPDMPADVALKNGGGIRATILGPNVTVLTVNSALAFDNKIAVVELTAAELLAVMENAVSRVPALDGRFPQIAGMTLVYDPSHPGVSDQLALEEASRVQSLVITRADGSEDVLVENFDVQGDLNRAFVIATNSFLITGGDGYQALKAAAESRGAQTPEIGERQILIDYITEVLGGNVDLVEPLTDPRVSQPSAEEAAMVESAPSADEAAEATVTAAGETAPSPDDGATDVAIWIHPTDVTQSTLIATDDNAGIVVYNLSGVEVQFLDLGELSNVDLRYNFPLGGELVTLVVAGVADEAMLHTFTVDAESGTLTPLAELETGLEHTSLCLYRSLISGNFYVFNLSEDGDVEQWQLSDDGSGSLSAELTREFSVGGELEACVADDELAQLYVSENDVALWKYGAEPEDGTARRIVDYVGGNITEEIEGVTLYYADDGTGYVIAANEKDHSLAIYRREGLNEFVGSLYIEGGDVDGITEPGGLDVINVALGDAFPAGLLVVSDDENSDPDDNTNFKLVSWADVATGLDLSADTESFDPRRVGMDGLSTDLVLVMPLAETDAVPSGGDAADDPAIWVHPDDAELSTIIGTDKQGGLAVYDLSGEEIQYLPLGRVNNVDLRAGFALGDETVTLVTAGNRTDDSLAILKVNPETRELEDVAARTVTVDVREVYGSCMYISPVSGKFYVFVNSAGSGDVVQFELIDNGSGLVDAEVVRTFSVGTQTEGCVADDETGDLYIGEENVGIWKYGAEPGAGEERVSVDVTGPDGYLTADVEGLAIYYGEDGNGYLIASSQGNNRFVVYERGGDNAYVGTFRIIANDDEDIDAVSGTDGIDVVSAPLGDAFPAGLFVAQDDVNSNPNEAQNFKLVSWADVVTALGIE